MTAAANRRDSVERCCFSHAFVARPSSKTSIFAPPVTSKAPCARSDQSWYRNPIEKTDGSRTAGFSSATSNVVPADKKRVVIAKLTEQINKPFSNANPPHQVEIGTMTYSKGTEAINVET